jgi:hypothetical protein
MLFKGQKMELITDELPLALECGQEEKKRTQGLTE